MKFIDQEAQHTCNAINPTPVDGCTACWTERGDESFSPSGRLLAFGRCDTCGAPCGADWRGETVCLDDSNHPAFRD